MAIRVLLLNVVLLFVSFTSVAQEKRQVAGVQTRLLGTSQERPVVYYHLNSEEHIDIGFDLIGDDNVSLYYRIYRLPKGEEAELPPIQYLSNSWPVEVSGGRHSRSTRIPYVHYEIQIPNEKVSPLMSGFYILEVYSNDTDYSRGEGLVRVPFTVVEPFLDVDLEFQSFNIEGDLSQDQEVAVTVQDEDSKLLKNPQDITVEVWKNYAEDYRELSIPSQIHSDKIVYDARRAAIFRGGSEYEHFDLLDISSGSMLGIDSVVLASNGYHVYLPMGHNRIDRPYIFQPDLDGKRKIRSTAYGVSLPELEGEYYTVHFALEYEPVKPELRSGCVFRLAGEAFCFFPERTTMQIDERNGTAYCSVLLKQGYVEYAYTAQDRSGLLHHMGGEHRQTSNTYTAFVVADSPNEDSYCIVGATVQRYMGL